MDTAEHPKRQWLNDRADELEDELLVLDGGYDEAILGITRVNSVHVVVYSVSKIIDKLVSEGLTYEDAYEHFSYNIECAYMGPNTPIYVEDPGV